MVCGSLFFFIINPFTCFVLKFNGSIRQYIRSPYIHIYIRKTYMECIGRGIFLLLSNENTCLSFIATFCHGRKGYNMYYVGAYF